MHVFLQIKFLEEEVYSVKQNTHISGLSDFQWARLIFLTLLIQTIVKTKEGPQIGKKQGCELIK